MANPNHGSSTPDASPPEQTAPAEAPPVGAKDVLLSYYFSQGSPDLQKLYFVWLSVRQPELRMTGEQATALLAACRPAAQAIVLRHGQHEPFRLEADSALSLTPAASINKDLLAEIIDLQNALNAADRPLGVDGLVPKIAREIIERDHYFLVVRGRRDRAPQAPGAPYSPRMDPYLSQLHYYALEGHTTGSALYDDICAAVGAYVRQLPSDDNQQAMIAAVNDVYTRYRPAPTLPD